MIGGSQRDLTAWAPAGKPRRRPGRIVFWVLVGLSAALVAAGIGIAAVTFRQYTDPTAAMEPTITPGEHVLVTLGADARRGDIIVFHPPNAPGDLSLKRLIGLPGDKVACCDAQGRVTVDGKALGETYIDGPPSKIKFSVTLGPGQIWVMGDNRNISLDSRGWGPARASTIVGHVFAMGNGVSEATFRTPQTYVADGLAPPDHRVPPFAWAVALATAGVLALILLGIVRAAIRRSRARKQPPGHTGYGPCRPYGAPGDAGNAAPPA